MSVKILFAAGADRWAQYETPLRRALADARIDADLTTDTSAPETVDYIVYAPNGPVSDFTPYTNCKLVQCLWAGVESAVDNPSLTQPFARMVDADGLTQGMVEWVTGHVLRHHLGMDRQIRKSGGWDALHAVPPLSRDRPVTILGLGALGTACAETLAGLGFPVTGWSRAAKTIDGVTCLHGADGLDRALSTAQILVLLLPLTAQTTGLLDADRLATLPAGAVVINPARGPMIVDADLIAALDRGHLSHATLDVFHTEPLPESHPFWAHPQVTITPHIASETRPESAARTVAENIHRGETGAPFAHLVDRDLGY